MLGMHSATNWAKNKAFWSRAYIRATWRGLKKAGIIAAVILAGLVAALIVWFSKTVSEMGS